MQRSSLPFEIQPDSGVPIYRQIMDQVCTMVASRRLTPGDMLPSIRQMAAGLQVNMMTISKAYTRLEAEGVLQRVRGRGMRVLAPATKTSLTSRKKELRELSRPLLTRAQQLGLSHSQILEILESMLKEP